MPRTGWTAPTAFGPTGSTPWTATSARSRRRDHRTDRPCARQPARPGVAGPDQAGRARRLVLAGAVRHHRDRRPARRRAVSDRRRLAADGGEWALPGGRAAETAGVHLAEDGDHAESLVTIDLADLGDTTELSLRHELLGDTQTGEDHAQGWSDCLDRLPAWLTAVASG